MRAWRWVGSWVQVQGWYDLLSFMKGNPFWAMWGGFGRVFSEWQTAEDGFVEACSGGVKAASEGMPLGFDYWVLL